MTYTIDESLENFRAWSGGKDTLNVLIDKGVCDKVEEFIEESHRHPDSPLILRQPPHDLPQAAPKEGPDKQDWIFS